MYEAEGLCLQRLTMVLRSFLTVAIIGAALVAQPAWADDWSREVGGWDVGRSGDTCAMMMEYEGEGATQVALMIQDDPASTILMISNANWSTRKDQAYELNYFLGEWVYTLPSIGIAPGYRKGFGTIVGKEFLANFARAGGLEIANGDTLIDDLSLEGSAAALNVLERCRTELARDLEQQRRDRERLAHIPRDPFASIEPVPEPAVAPDAPRGPVPVIDWARRVAENYPSRAIRDEIEGNVGIRVAVSTTGRVTSCSVTSSSGSAVLDEAACESAQRYGRFEPALDAAGTPTEGAYNTVITYSLSR